MFLFWDCVFICNIIIDIKIKVNDLDLFYYICIYIVFIDF